MSKFSSVIKLLSSHFTTISWIDLFQRAQEKEMVLGIYINEDKIYIFYYISIN